MCSMLASGTAYAKKPNVVTASQNYIEKEFPNIGKFDAISNIGSVDVDFTQSAGDETSVKVWGSDNLIEFVELKNINGTLTISLKYPRNTAVHGERRLKVIATSPKLKKVDITGSGDIRLRHGIITENFTISVTGSGDVEIDDLKCKNATFSVNGSGDIEIRSLDAGNVNFSIKGSGDVECGQVRCKNILTASVVGSGDIEINNIEAATVKATTTGSGDIELRGKTQNAEYTANGSGKISAHSLQSENVKAISAASGGISVHASKSITATANGSGTITYSGNPAKVNAQGREGKVRAR